MNERNHCTRKNIYMDGFFLHIIVITLDVYEYFLLKYVI